LKVPLRVPEQVVWACTPVVSKAVKASANKVEPTVVFQFMGNIKFSFDFVTLIYLV
jgi:hypothetical protein